MIRNMYYLYSIVLIRVLIANISCIISRTIINNNEL